MCADMAPGPEWVLQGADISGKIDAGSYEALAAAARYLWPYVQVRAGRALFNKKWIPDHSMFVVEIWEEVLRSTAQRVAGDRKGIGDLRCYLMGAFYHEFARALWQEQRSRNIKDCVSLPESSGKFRGVADDDWLESFERQVQLREIVEQMNEWTANVWTLYELGYSWKEIGKRIGLTEREAKDRYLYELEKIRRRLTATAASRVIATSLCKQK